MNSVGLFRKLLGGSSCVYLKHLRTSVKPLKSGAPLTQRACISAQPVRVYSQLRHLSLLIKGITTQILRFANAVREMKNERLIKRINRHIDPSFSLNQFALDVAHAFSKLSHLLATRQYRKIRELTYDHTERPINFLQEYVESLLDQDLVQHIDLKPEEFSVLDPYIVETLTQDDVHAVIVDVAAFGVKFIEDQAPVMLHLHVRFCQAYADGTASGWLVVDIPFIHIRRLSHLK